MPMQVLEATNKLFEGRKKRKTRMVSNTDKDAANKIAKNPKSRKRKRRSY